MVDWLTFQECGYESQFWSRATPSLKHFDLTCACLSGMLNQGCNEIVRVSESSDWKLPGVLRWNLWMRLDQKNNTDWWPLHCSGSVLYFMNVCSLNVFIWRMCVILCWSLTNLLTFTQRSTRREGGSWVYGAKAADSYDPCVAPEMSERRPPQAYMWQWIPLSPTDQPPHLTHMFPIMVGTFQALPSIPQKKIHHVLSTFT